MRFEYNPVIIRYQNKTETFASSGIHLVLKPEKSSKNANDHNSIIDEFFLTINHLPDLSKFQILISENYILGTDQIPDQVIWHRGKLDKVYNLPFDKISGFNVFPFDSFNHTSSSSSSSQQQKVSLIKIRCINIDISNITTMSQFDIDEGTNVGDEINIICQPFILTNSFLFKKFKCQSNIIGKLFTKDTTIVKNFHYYWLSDLKYLDDIHGGIVMTKPNEKIIGLVFGNLRKLNGDGDLTIIVPIEKIVELIGLPIPTNSHKPSLSTSLVYSSVTPPTTISSSLESSGDYVIPLLITDSRGNNTWGSSVLFQNNVLITNQHVIQPYMDDINNGQCVVKPQTTSLFTLGKKDKIIIPISGIDLAFIFLDKPITSKSRLVKICHQYNQGDAVYSSSYGLIYTGTSDNIQEEPIKSNGIINQIIKLSIQQNLKQVMNCMLISSSNCWNGSSGGGLFKQQTNEFIGLICSNANVKLPLPFNNIGKGKVDRFEKVPSFSFILPIQIIEYCYYMILCNQDTTQINLEGLINLWNLKSLHQDILLESSKL